MHSPVRYASIKEASTVYYPKGIPSGLWDSPGMGNRVHNLLEPVELTVNGVMPAIQ